MDVRRTSAYDRRLGVPFILLILCMLALVVSLIGLYRASTITHSRVADLQVSWEALMEGGVDGAELLATDRHMRALARPVPGAESAAAWSLAMAALSLVFLTWLVITARSVENARSDDEHNSERNDQAAMAKLLDEIAPLASGELGVKATAQHGTPGALADAFNFAVGELQRLTATQMASARSVGDAVNKIRDTGANIERRCIDQSSRIHSSSNLLLGMSSSASALSAHAAGTTQILSKVLEHTDKGAIKQHSWLQQMHAVRSQAEDSFKRLQSLAMHLRQIEDNVGQLEEVARRTHLVALNSTLRATTAGSKGDSNLPLSVISELSGELTSLVEETNSAIAEIKASFDHLRTDESTARELMGSLLEGYESQEQQAGQLDSVKRIIHDNIDGLQQHVAIMADQTVQYSGVVRELSGNMDLINQLTQDSIGDVQKNVNHLDDLNKMSKKWRQHLSDFSMPGSDDSVTSGASKSAARLAAERALING